MTPHTSVLAPFAAILSLLSVSSFAQPNIPKWAHEFDAKMYAAYNGEDLSSLMKLFAEDAVAVYSGKTLRGRSAIEAYFQEFFKKSSARCTSKIEGAQALTKTAISWGRDSCKETPESGGTARTYNGRWLSTFERQSDGSWLLVRDSYDEIK